MGLSGRIWGTGHESAHDHDLFQTWRNVKLDCASHMAANLDACRIHMKALGVDPIAFAETFVAGETRETRLERAQEMAQRWRLPELVHGQPQHLCDTRAAAREALVTAWKTSVLDNPNSSHLMLAYTNKDVTSLNRQARTLMRACGVIKGPEYTYATTKDKKTLSMVALFQAKRLFNNSEGFLWETGWCSVRTIGALMLKTG